jgi:hypothetical protein
MEANNPLQIQTSSDTLESSFLVSKKCFDNVAYQQPRRWH